VPHRRVPAILLFRISKVTALSTNRQVSPSALTSRSLASGRHSQPKRRSEAILANRVQSEFAQKRILCVDDNVLELTLRGKILELQGYSVVLLSCPIQALRCDLSAFDLAVLDFDMPGLNGRDLFLRMRALRARFPILLLSAFASTLCPEDCVLFSKCLNKGEPVAHLLNVIAAFLDPNEIPDFGR
jgi:CheY-like chemotaxis protein